MANTDRPRGFAPHGALRRITEYTAGASCAVGDAVLMQADGKVDPVATGGSAHTGAVTGIAMDAAASDGDTIRVADDPDQKYVIQADDAGVAAQADIGRNYSILGTNPVGTESRQEVDASTGATTATLPLKVLAVSSEEGNAFGAQADVIVKINNHQLDGGTGTVGTS